jgi:hypothetical protein
MLINGVADFDAKYPGMTAEEFVDDALARGIVPRSQSDIYDEQNAFLRRQAKPDEPDPFAPDSEDLLVHPQPAIAVYTNARGQIVIRQEGDYREEDRFVFISPEHLEKLIARLREFLPNNGEVTR